MDNIIFEIDESIRENYKQLSYGFSLLSCYFQQLSSPLLLYINEKKNYKYENNKIYNNINLSFISPMKNNDDKTLIKKKENIMKKIIKKKRNKLLGKKRKEDKKRYNSKIQSIKGNINGRKKFIFNTEINYKNLKMIFGPYDNKIFCNALITVFENYIETFEKKNLSNNNLKDWFELLKKKIYEKYPPIIELKD